MSNGTHPPSPFQGATDYPDLAAAIGCAEDLGKGAPGTRVKGEGWTYYALSPLMGIFFVELQTNIYLAFACPQLDYEAYEAGKEGALERPPHWLLEYHPEAETWNLLAASREVGDEEFYRLVRELKGA